MLTKSRRRRLALVLILFSGAVMTQCYADEDLEELGMENEEDYVDEDDVDEDFFDPEYVANHIVDIDPDHDCRDDAFINCTEVEESGNCHPDEHDEYLLKIASLCPVTCGSCKLPERTSVWVEYECFQHGEDIHVFFSSASPEPSDFIGIYPSYFNFEENPELLEVPEMWLYTCGSLHEECRTAFGGIIFGDMGPDDHGEWLNFPLESGKYRALLVRDDSVILSESQIFTAKPEGHTCYSACHDSIYSDQTCYTENEAIRVTFENCFPRDDDHIAIYYYTETVPGEKEPLLWLGTCGTQECTGEVASDTITFDASPPVESGVLNFPLLPGRYKAHLMRTSEGGKFGRSSTEIPFDILHEGESCYHDEEDL